MSEGVGSLWCVGSAIDSIEPRRARVGVEPAAPWKWREDLQELELQTIDALDMVVGQLKRALESVGSENVELARLVIADDKMLDERYAEVHQGVLCLLARPAPAAGDPRSLAALLTILRCVERIGGQCAAIAKLVPFCCRCAAGDGHLLDATGPIGQAALSLVLRARDAFTMSDGPLARGIIRDGAAAEGLHREIVSDAVGIGEAPRARERAMFMILLARCLQRIVENAVTIAEHTILLVPAPALGPTISALRLHQSVALTER